MPERPSCPSRPSQYVIELRWTVNNGLRGYADNRPEVVAGEARYASKFDTRADAHCWIESHWEREFGGDGLDSSDSSLSASVVAFGPEVVRA